jgi:hypothetical protein
MAALALGAFVGTNVDNLLALGAQMAATEPRRHRRIAEGQFTATIIVIALCALLGSGLKVVPHTLIGLMGLIPLALGIRAGVLLAQHRADDRTVPAAAGFLSSLGVTLAISADNVGVYLPILATSGLLGGVVSVGIWVLADLGLIGLAGWIGRHPAARAQVEKVGPLALPVLFVALGVIIIVRSGTFGL